MFGIFLYFGRVIWVAALSCKKFFILHGGAIGETQWSRWCNSRKVGQWCDRVSPHSIFRSIFHFTFFVFFVYFSSLHINLVCTNCCFPFLFLLSFFLYSVFHFILFCIYFCNLVLYIWFKFHFICLLEGAMLWLVLIKQKVSCVLW